MLEVWGVRGYHRLVSAVIVIPPSREREREKHTRALTHTRSFPLWVSSELEDKDEVLHHPSPARSRMSHTAVYASADVGYIVDVVPILQVSLRKEGRRVAQLHTMTRSSLPAGTCMPGVIMLLVMTHNDFIELGRIYGAALKE